MEAACRAEATGSAVVGSAGFAAGGGCAAAF
jgi:hypothetical protein